MGYNGKKAIDVLEELIENHPEDGLLGVFGKEEYTEYINLLQLQVFDRFGYDLIAVKKEVK